MRLIEADDYRLRYHRVHVHEVSLRSPPLALSAATSTCCNARTYHRNDKVLCFVCRQPCREREWRAPNTRANHGGGRYIRVRETRNVDRGDRLHRAMWGYIRWLRPLNELFAVPVGADPHAWARVLLAWDLFLGVGCRAGSFEAAARVGAAQAVPADRARWTAENAAAWVNCGRRAVVRRVTGEEIPGPRIGAVMDAVGAA